MYLVIDPSDNKFQERKKSQFYLKSSYDVSDLAITSANTENTSKKSTFSIRKPISLFLETPTK